MIEIATSFALAFWASLVQVALGALEQTAGNAIGNRLTEAMENAHVRKDVTKAASNALKEFDRELPAVSMALAEALRANSRFITSSKVTTILADAAFHPYNQRQQVQQLAELLHQFAPTVPLERCAGAAELLLGKVHDKIQHIKELQVGIQVLQGQEILAAVTKPTYANHLDERLRVAAVAIEQKYGQRYVAAPHILYALAQQADSSAARVLAKRGASPANIEAVVARLKPNYECDPDSDSPSAVAVWALAPEIARRRADSNIRTEHVLAAIAAIALPADLHYSETTAKVFVALCLDPRDIRAEADGLARLVSFMSSIGGDY